MAQPQMITLPLTPQLYSYVWSASRNELISHYLYLRESSMESASEQSDNLTGVAQIKESSQQQQRQQRKRNLLKKAVLLLLACSLLLVFVVAVKEYALQSCQQKVATEDVKPKGNGKGEGEEIGPQLPESVSIDAQKHLPLVVPPPTASPPPAAAVLPGPSIKPTQIIHHQYELSDDSLNLWLLPREQKIALLSRVRSSEKAEQLGFTAFLKSKDQQVEPFFTEFENRSEVLDWSTWEITEAEHDQLVTGVRAALEERKKILDEQIATYTRKYNGKSGYMPDQNKGITYEQFLQALHLKKLTGASIFPSKDAELEQLEAEEWQSYEDKYGLGYEELPVCILVPTYNNMPGLRYVWSIESLLQQNYTNFRAVIIDDGSKDGTAEATGSYLKWRGAEAGRFVVVGGKERRTALENVYYGAHKYCDYGQILVIFDGDDELLGRQALKVLNALYQSRKYYLVYSQFISFNPSNRREELEVGLSEDFPYFVKARNSYRTFKHSYSQLRSVLSDLVLLQPLGALQSKSGQFFALLYDNALFYPAFEMSCANFLYLPEIFYWYNINTGANDWKMAKTPLYKENRFGIELQKPFRCIEQQLREAIKEP